MDDGSRIQRAENRVREMNRMTQHYAEQGRKYFSGGSPPSAAGSVTRFEPIKQQQCAPKEPLRPPQRSNSRGQGRSCPPAEPPPAPKCPEPPPPPPLPKPSCSDGLGSILGIKLDGEKADIKLIAALGYLLI